ncbi:MAG: hypothetical protein ACRD9R_13335 [Pyrinomonadaceae bacterium]
MSLDPKGFFGRVCVALGVQPGRGAKAKIAKKLGFSKSSAGLWEKGEMPGINSLQHVVKVSELSNTSLHWLLTNDGPKDIRDIREFSIEDIQAQLLTKLSEMPDGDRHYVSMKIIHALTQTEFEDSTQIPILKPINPSGRVRAGKGRENEQSKTNK